MRKVTQCEYLIQNEKKLQSTHACYMLRNIESLGIISSLRFQNILALTKRGDKYSVTCLYLSRNLFPIYLQCQMTLTPIEVEGNKFGRITKLCSVHLINSISRKSHNVYRN